MSPSRRPDERNGARPGTALSQREAMPSIPSPSSQSIADIVATKQLMLPDGPVGVRLRRSDRARRISLRLDPRGGGVVLTLPATTRLETGVAMLRDHAGWVQRQLERTAAPVRFEVGAPVPIDGEPHLIRHDPEGRGGAWLEEGELRVSGDLAFLQRRVSDFMRQIGAQRLSLRLGEHAVRTGLSPRRVAIRDTSSRWGSCSADGRVMLSWRLVMAPTMVQDYVILHELAHLRHLNHSQAFWTLVDTLTPYRRKAENWLRAHGPSLMRAGAGSESK